MNEKVSAQTPEEMRKAEEMLTPSERMQSVKRHFEKVTLPYKDRWDDENLIDIPPEIYNEFTKFATKHHEISNGFSLASNWYYLLQTGIGKKLFPDFGWDFDKENIEKLLSADPEDLSITIDHLLQNFYAVVQMTLDTTLENKPQFGPIEESYSKPESDHKYWVMQKILNDNLNYNKHGARDFLNDYLKDYVDEVNGENISK